jgi:endogenous inhibitor of DNA gyrase (YacG/DUF329 family)
MKPTLDVARSVRCPGCGGPSIYSLANPYRPFCSQRCKNGDFGAWASEAYKVPADSPSEGDDAADAEGHETDS